MIKNISLYRIGRRTITWVCFGYWTLKSERFWKEIHSMLTPSWEQTRNPKSCLPAGLCESSHNIFLDRPQASDCHACLGLSAVLPAAHFLPELNLKSLHLVWVILLHLHAAVSICFCPVIWFFLGNPVSCGETENCLCDSPKSEVSESHLKNPSYYFPRSML